MLFKYQQFLKAIFCWWKALGICKEGVWIRSDFLYYGRKNIQFVKPACSVLCLEIKACTLPPKKGNDEGHKTNSHTHGMLIGYLYPHFNSLGFNVWQWKFIVKADWLIITIDTTEFPILLNCEFTKKQFYMTWEDLWFY